MIAFAARLLGRGADWPSALSSGVLLVACVADRPQQVPPAAPSSLVETPLAAPMLTGTAEQGGLLRGEMTMPGASLLLDGRVVAAAEDGRFILGFDRDAPSSMMLTVEKDGRSLAFPLPVRPRAWRIERVDTPYRAGKTDAEFARVRPAELAAIAVARATVTDAQGWRQAMRWPVAGRQSGWFGSQRVYRGEPGSYHSGADVAVPVGTPVRAPADGVVVLASQGPFTLEGNLLLIDHGAGLSSALLHLSRVDVRAGEHVRQGQPVALSGATGRATGPHLHWSLQWRGAKLDPEALAGAPDHERRRSSPESAVSFP